MQQEQEEIPLQELTAKAKIEPKHKPRNVFLYFVAATANLLSFATGCVVAWVTAVIPKLDGSQSIDHNPLGRTITPSEVSWLAGLFPLGASLGPLAAGKISDKIGRKRMLLLLACLHITSLTIPVFANTISQFHISRFLSGIATGSVFSVLSIFLAEISENHNRGTLGCLMSIFFAAGVNFALIVGPYLSVQNFSLVCISPLLIFVPGFWAISPETPLFLASVNHDDKLAASLLKLRSNKEEIQQELTNILEVAQRNRNDKGGVKDLFKAQALRKGLVISMGTIALQQLVGYSAIISYMQAIFEAAKIELASEICVMIVGASQVFGTILSSIIVDRSGRRILLLGSCVGTSMTLAALGLYYYLKTNQFQVDWMSWLPILSLVLYTVAFSVGLGPVPWVITAELFPSNVRSVAAALTSFVCFIISFIVVVTFPFLSLTLGMANCFFMFSLISIAGCVFIYWVLPETKGKSLQDIQKLLSS